MCHGLIKDRTDASAVGGGPVKDVKVTRRKGLYVVKKENTAEDEGKETRMATTRDDKVRSRRHLVLTQPSLPQHTSTSEDMTTTYVTTPQRDDNVSDKDGRRWRRHTGQQGAFPPPLSTYSPNSPPALSRRRTTQRPRPTQRRRPCKPPSPTLSCTASRGTK